MNLRRAISCLSACTLLGAFPALAEDAPPASQPVALPAAAAATTPAPVASSPDAAAASAPAAPSPDASAAPAPVASAPDGAGDTEDLDASAPDAAPIDEEVKAESAELEQMRAAEERVHPGEESPLDDPTVRDGSRAGLDAPLKQRLRDAFGREGGLATEPVGRIAGLPEIDHDLKVLQAEYDIPIDVNEAVVSYIRFFQNIPVVRKHFVRWLGRSHRYIPIFRKILRDEGLPEDTVYLAMIESGFSNMATSRARAVGPWQFIRETGQRMGLKQDFWVDERRDPEKAAHAAARYLKELYAQTGDWRLAWAGYNAGVGKIYKARAHGQTDFWSMTRGRVLAAETKGYVPKLMAAAIIAKHPEAFGFMPDEIEAEQWRDYDEVTVPQAAPLSAVAEAAGCTVEDLLELNPALRRTWTPPRAQVVKVPRGQGELFARNWPEVSKDVGKLAFAQVRVRRGDSLRSIARRYRIEQVALARMNGLRMARRIPAGTELVIPLNAASRSAGEFAFESEAASAAASAREPAPPVRRARKLDVRTVSYARRGGGHAVESGGRTTVHVRAGDTLWSIAQRFGVAVDQLCRWNGIRSSRKFKLIAGRALVVHVRRGEAANALPVPSARAG